MDSRCRRCWIVFVACLLAIGLLPLEAETPCLDLETSLQSPGCDERISVKMGSPDGGDLDPCSGAPEEVCSGGGWI
jgi:hypothetical protein